MNRVQPRTYSDVASDLARNVRFCRMTANISMSRLSKLSCVAFTTISRIEKCIGGTDLETITRIANVFYLEPNELLESSLDTLLLHLHRTNKNE